MRISDWSSDVCSSDLTILSDYDMSEPEDYTFIPVGDGGTALAGLMRGEIVAYVGGVADRAILTYRGMPMRDITPDRFQTLFGNGYAVTRELDRKSTRLNFSH